MSGIAPASYPLNEMQNLETKSSHNLIYVLVIVLIIIVCAYIYNKNNKQNTTTTTTQNSSVSNTDVATLQTSATNIQTSSISAPIPASVDEGNPDSGMTSSVSTALLASESTH